MTLRISVVIAIITVVSLCRTGSAALVGHWSFDSIVSGQVLDSTANANHGTLIGNPTLENGILGTGLAFHGSGDYVDCGSGSSLNVGGGNFTIAFWIKAPYGAVSVLSRGNSTINQWAITVSSNPARPKLQAKGTFITTPTDVPVTTTVLDNQWHYVVIVRSGSTATVYVDGESYSSTSLGNMTESGKLLIGAQTTAGGGGWFTGTIDELSIYSNALSAADISRDYAVMSGLTVDARDYGAIPDDGLDDQAGLERAIDSLDGTGGIVVLSPGNYDLGSPLDIRSGVSLIGSGAGNGVTIINYGNFSYALRLNAVSGSRIGHFVLKTAHTGASAIWLTNGCRRVIFENLQVESPTSSSATGYGFHFDSGNGWTGGIRIKDAVIEGFKYGIYMRGNPAGNGEVTCIDMSNIFFNGRSAGVVSGSAAIYMEGDCNGVGTQLRGGTIEYFATGIYHENGAFGGIFECDMEGNTNDYVVGDSFTGRITSPIAHNYLVAGANGSANRWLREEHKNGQLTRETYYSQKHVIYEGSSAEQEFSLYRGASLISGGSPTLKFKVNVGGSGDSAVHRNYIQLQGNRIAWNSAIPASGTWAKGDTVYNTGAAAGGKVGWVCITAGTPGTWKAFGTIDP